MAKHTRRKPLHERDQGKPKKPRALQERQEQTTNAPSGAFLDLQQQVGNQAFIGLVQLAEAESVEDEPLDLSTFGKSGRLPGHPKTTGMVPEMPRANSTGIPDVQKRGPFGVEATVNLTFNPPAIDSSKTGEEIGNAHGRPGAVGWTTPTYNVSPPTGSSRNIQIDVAIGFDMELASDYTGVMRQVLQDHEMGHVNIGRKIARKHFAENLERNLESRVSLNSTNVPPAINAAIAGFVSEEGSESLEYDTADYPRMLLAYEGASTPLSDLEADSARIQQMAERLRNFNGTVLSATQGQVEVLSQDVIDAYGELETGELNMLQYNPEFKALVETAKTRIDTFTEGLNFEIIFFDISLMRASTRSQLNTLRAALDQFTWRAPGGEAG